MASKIHAETSAGSRFPSPPMSHGTAMATVKVGKDPNQRIFTIHKQLLSQASSYFDRALNGDFKESTAGILQLEHHCVVAFEVLYQWLYTGVTLAPVDFKKVEKIEDHYSDGAWEQVYWLRLFSLADETMVTELKSNAYSALTKQYFCRPPSLMPDTAFLQELFDAENPHEVLQEYLVEYASFCIATKRVKDAPVWQAAFNDVPQYATRVLLRVVELSDNGAELSVEHPLDQDRFLSIVDRDLPTTSEAAN